MLRDVMRRTRNYPECAVCHTNFQCLHRIFVFLSKKKTIYVRLSAPIM